MLDESQLDKFLDEFFGEEESASGAACLKNSEKQNPFHRKEVPSEELEEYTLPSDGMIIRQMERQGKVSRRTWFAFAVMLIVVPILLFFSVKIWGGRKYLLCSLIVTQSFMQTPPDQKAEYVNIHTVNQLVKHTENQGQSDIVFIVVFGENAIKVTNVNQNQGIKAKWPAVEQIHQQTGKKAKNHARGFSLNKTEGKSQNQEQIGRSRQKGKKGEYAVLHRKSQKNQQNIQKRLF